MAGTPRLQPQEATDAMPSGQSAGATEQRIPADTPGRHRPRQRRESLRPAAGPRPLRGSVEEIPASEVTETVAESGPERPASEVQAKTAETSRRKPEPVLPKRAPPPAEPFNSDDMPTVIAPEVVAEVAAPHRPAGKKASLESSEIAPAPAQALEDDLLEMQTTVVLPQTVGREEHPAQPVAQAVERGERPARPVAQKAEWGERPAPPAAQTAEREDRPVPPVAQTAERETPSPSPPPVVQIAEREDRSVPPVAQIAGLEEGPARPVAQTAGLEEGPVPPAQTAGQEERPASPVMQKAEGKTPSPPPAAQTAEGRERSDQLPPPAKAGPMPETRDVSPKDKNVPAKGIMPRTREPLAPKRMPLAFRHVATAAESRLQGTSRSRRSRLIARKVAQRHETAVPPVRRTAEPVTRLPGGRVARSPEKEPGMADDRRPGVLGSRPVTSTRREGHSTGRPGAGMPVRKSVPAAVAAVRRSEAALPPRHLHGRLGRSGVADRSDLARQMGTPPGSQLDPAAIWYGPSMRALPFAREVSPAAEVAPAKGAASVRPVVAFPAREAARLIQRTVAADAGDGDALTPTTGDTAPAAGPSGEAAIGSAVNVDTLARQVYQILRRRLRVEQERMRGTISR